MRRVSEGETSRNVRGGRKPFGMNEPSEKSAVCAWAVSVFLRGQIGCRNSPIWFVPLPVVGLGAKSSAPDSYPAFNAARRRGIGEQFKVLFLTEKEARGQHRRKKAVRRWLADHNAADLEHNAPIVYHRFGKKSSQIVEPRKKIVIVGHVKQFNLARSLARPNNAIISNAFQGVVGEFVDVMG